MTKRNTLAFVAIITFLLIFGGVKSLMWARYEASRMSSL